MEIFGKYVKDYLITSKSKLKQTREMSKTVDGILQNESKQPQIVEWQIEEIKQKLENCRNPVFNPRTPEFKKAQNSDDDYYSTNRVEDIKNDSDEEAVATSNGLEIRTET